MQLIHLNLKPITIDFVSDPLSSLALSLQLMFAPSWYSDTLCTVAVELNPPVVATSWREKMPSVRAASLTWLGVKYISVIPLLLHVSGAVCSDTSEHHCVSRTCTVCWWCQCNCGKIVHNGDRVYSYKLTYQHVFLGK